MAESDRERDEASEGAEAVPEPSPSHALGAEDDAAAAAAPAAADVGDATASEAAGETAPAVAEAPAVSDAMPPDAAANGTPAAAPAEVAPVPAAGGAVAASASVGAWARVRGFFWLPERMAAARQEGFGEATPGFAEYLLGRDGVVAAQRLGELADSKTGVLLLHREAAELLVVAHLKRLGLACDPDPAVRWATLAAQPEGQVVSSDLSEESRGLLAEALAEGGTLRIAALSKDARAALAAALTLLTEQLTARLEREAHRVESVLYQRWLRIGAAVLLVVALVAGSVFALRSMGGEVNLARDKKVRISSNSKKYGCNPQRVVDGDRNELGFHTNNESRPWGEIDLGEEHSIEKVVVFNRATHPERAVPLEIQVATEPGRFEPVARRDEVFDVWTAEFPSRSARYVRVRLDKKGFLHLAEVEVY